MGLMTTTISASGFAAWIQCDDCKAETPKVNNADSTRAKSEAARLAQLEGFVTLAKGQGWVCPACRIRRLSDKLKREFPALCARYGVPLPGSAVEPAPPAKGRRKK